MRPTNPEHLRNARSRISSQLTKASYVSLKNQKCRGGLLEYVNPIKKPIQANFND